jgi:hypothetical protein
MPGPLPNGQARRRNAPTISTTTLPAAGRKGRIPKCPYDLGKEGADWWKWAWRLPQATEWDDGSLYVVARRALLEDHAAALRFTDELDLQDLFDADNREAQHRVEWALGLLKRSATGEVQLMKEMRELDNRLGLNPKAMGELRWTIAEEPEPAAAPAPTRRPPAKVRRLKVVDPSAASA